MPAGNNIGSAQLISLNPSVQTFTDSVQFGLPDFYSFVIPAGSSSAVSITLSGLTADANLELLNGAGTAAVDNSGIPVPTSTNTGTLVDVVNTLLAPGTYYIRVTPGAPGDPASPATTTPATPYNLNFASDNGIRADIAWRNVLSGETGFWFLDGNILSSAGLTTPVGANSGWKLQATGDFNGDGNGDLVWRNFITGETGVWYMNGTALINGALTESETDLNWEVRGAGDFDGDGRTDLLWRNQVTGQNRIWFLNGTNGLNVVSRALINPLPVASGWQIQGAGDFNGDGRSDVILRNTLSGDVAFWFMNGSTITGSAFTNPVRDAAWEIRGSADFNQDGKADLLWRNNSTGENVAWLMDGPTLSAGIVFDSVPANSGWQPLALSGRRVPVPLRDIAGNSDLRALNIGDLNGFGTYRASISSTNPVDYYQFTLPTAGRVGITFSGANGGNLTGDLNLILSNSTGTLTQSLAQTALTPETLTTSLPAGTYTVRVLPLGTAASAYQLGLSILPTLVSNNPLAINEGATQTISSSSLLVSEGAKSPNLITYSIITAPSTASGNLSLAGTAIFASSTFTQADINAGRLTYRQNGSETPLSDSFTFGVSTGSGGPLPTTIAPTVFSLNFVPSNDPPVLLSTNLSITLTEGTATAITSTLLSATDIEQTPAQLVYSITSAPANGTILRGGLPLVGGTFTQADVNTGTLLSYSHNGSEAVTDGFTFTLSDGALGGTLAPRSLSISVIGTDDPPVLVSNTGITLAEFQSRLLATSLLNATDVDTTNPDLIIYSVLSAPTNGVLSRGTVSQISTFTQGDLNNGRIVYGHNRPQTNTDTFTFTVSNPGGPVGATRTFNVAVTGVNFIPAIATNAGLTLSEGSTAALSTTLLQVSDADSAAPQLTYSLIGAPVNGSLTRVGFGTLAVGSTFTQLDLDTAGRINYVHGGSESASDRFIFSVIDQGGAQLSNQTFSISVLPTNDAPTIASNVGVTLGEGTTSVIRTSLLSASDVDSPVAQLVYSVTTAPTNGVLLLNQTTLNGTFTQADINGGLLSYRHSGNESLEDSFGFSLSDGLAPALNGVFTIAVTSTNDAPSLLSNVGFSVTEGSAFTLTSNELFITDFDGGPAPSPIYTIASAPTVGTLQLSGVNLTVGSTFTQSDIGNGQVRYQNNGSETNRDRFTFTASDGSSTGLIAITPVSITVINTNDAPTLLSNRSLTLNEQATTRITTSLLSASDADTPSAQVVYSIVTAPVNGTLLLNGTPLASTFTQADLTSSGGLSYRHNGSETLTDSFEFTLSDGTTTLPNEIFNIVVNPVNDPLTIVSNRGLTVAEGPTPTVISSTELFITDVDGPATSPLYSLVSAPTAGTLQLQGVSLSVGSTFAQSDIDSGLITYQNNGSETARDRFTFTASDGGTGGTLANTNFSITITNVNDAPTLVSLPTTVTAAEDTNFTFSGLNRILTTDLDSTTLTATLAVNSGTLTISTAGVTVGSNNSSSLSVVGTIANLNTALNTLAYRGLTNFNGEDTLTVVLSDGNLSTTGTVSVNVTPVNDAPTLTVPVAQTVSEDLALSFASLFTFADVDGSATPESVLLSVTNGTLTVGSFPSLQFFGGDPTNGSNTLSFSGTVDDVQAALNSLVYTGRSNFNGSDRLTITVNDNGTPTSQAITRSVPITITAVNDAPSFTAGSDVISVNEDSPAYSQLWATGISRGGGTDEASQTLSFSVATDNSSIFTTTGQPRISTTTGALTFTLNPNANTAAGPVTVTVNLSDSGNGTNISSPSVFTINVNPVNDAPTFSIPTTTVTVAEDAGPQTLQLVTASSISAGPNEVGQNLTFVLDQLSTTNAGLFLPGSEPTLDPATGRLVYQTAPDATGTAVFRATLIDDGGTDNGFGATGVDRLSRTFTINVTSVNDAPVLTIPVGPLSIDEDTRLFIPDISVTDVDAGSTSVRVTLSAASGNLSLGTAPTGVTVTGNNSRTVILAGSQTAIAPVLSTLSYQTTANFAGPTDTLTIRATDAANASSATQSLAILVNPVNDAPTLTVSSTTLTAQEDVNLSIGSTVIRGTDIDTGSVTVTVTANNGGTLSLGGQAGASVTTVIAASTLNTGLAGLSYRGAQDYNGPDSLTVTVDDGSGGIVERSLSVNVVAVNDAPVLTVPATAIPAVAEGTPIFFSGDTLNVTDVDSARITVGLAVQNGTVTLGALDGLTVVSGTNGSARITYAGAPDVINSALGGLTYNPNAFYNGADTLTITATDGVTPAPTRTLSLTVTPVNDPPVLTRNLPLAVLEGNTASSAVTVISTSLLSATDPDSPAASTLVYSVTSSPTNGILQRSGAGPAITSFTQADLAAGVITYAHNGSETTEDSFVFQLTDGNPANALPPTVFNINVTPLNDVPVLTTPNPTISVSSTNRTVVLNLAGGSTNQLTATDVDTPPTQLVYRVDQTSLSTFGNLQKSGAPLAVGGTFTQADLNNGLVTYNYIGASPGNANIVLQLSDGTTSFSVTVRVTAS